MNQPPTQHPPTFDSPSTRSQSPLSTSSGTPGGASELKSDAKHLGDKAANRLHSEVDARKGTAVNQAKSVSTAIQRAADGLDESTPNWLRSAFQQGAQQIQRFADSIDQKDSRQLLNDAQSFARNSPGTFLAACAAAGFAAARVFRAGGQPDTGNAPSWDQGEIGQGSSFRSPGAEPSARVHATGDAL